MTSEGSKRRDFLSLVFITKSISKRLLIKSLYLFLYLFVICNRFWSYIKESKTPCHKNNFCSLHLTFDISKQAKVSLRRQPGAVLAPLNFSSVVTSPSSMKTSVAYKVPIQPRHTTSSKGTAGRRCNGFPIGQQSKFNY